MSRAKRQRMTPLAFLIAGICNASNSRMTSVREDSDVPNMRELRFRRNDDSKQYDTSDVHEHLFAIDPTQKRLRLSFCGKRDFGLLMLHSMWEELNDVEASTDIDWRTEDMIPEDFYAM